MIKWIKKLYNNYIVNKEKERIEKLLNRDYEFYRVGSEPYLYYRSNFDRPGFTLVLIYSLGASRLFGNKQDFTHKVNDLKQIKVTINDFAKPAGYSLSQALYDIKQNFTFDSN